MRAPSASTSSTGQSPALLARIEEKKAELESLRELRDLSAAVAGQMEALETKLSTLSDGTEGMSMPATCFHVHETNSGQACETELRRSCRRRPRCDRSSSSDSCSHPNGARTRTTGPGRSSRGRCRGGRVATGLEPVYISMTAPSLDCECLNKGVLVPFGLSADSIQQLRSLRRKIIADKSPQVPFPRMKWVCRSHQQRHVSGTTLNRYRELLLPPHDGWQLARCVWM
ncbi:DASH complex subunit-like protein [Ilyonectria robusta]